MKITSNKLTIIALVSIGITLCVLRWSTHLPQVQQASSTNTEQVAKHLPEKPEATVQPTKTTDLKAIQEHFLRQLDQEEQSIWQALASIGVTKDRYERAHKNYYHDYCRAESAVTNKAVSPATIKSIQGIIKKHGLNPNAYPVYGYNDLSPAAATDRAIYVNDAVFNKLTHPARRFVVTHELQHMLHGDNCNKYVIERLTNNDTINLARSTRHNPKAIDHPMLRLARFKEKRADVKTAIQNPEMAQAFYAYAKEQFDMYGETPGATHPKNSARITLAQEIVNAMNGGLQTA